MARLAELHPVVITGNKIVARHAAMRVVTGDAGQLAAPAPLRRIGFFGKRMAAAVAEGKYMYALDYLVMTGEAKLVDRLQELFRVFT